MKALAESTNELTGMLWWVHNGGLKNGLGIGLPLYPSNGSVSELLFFFNWYTFGSVPWFENEKLTSKETFSL